MARFQGYLGFFSESEETEPGVYDETFKEVSCKGDILRSNQRYDSGEKVSDDITLWNRFSIIINPFIESNIVNIRYLKWNNIKWKVTSIDIERPRLILTVRGVWNV